jgi:hypothetical protein
MSYKRVVLLKWACRCDKRAVARWAAGGMGVSLYRSTVSAAESEFIAV